MPFIRAAESLEIPAPSQVVYDIIADYREGHPRILPPEYFGRLEVDVGGRGAGTKIRFEMKAFGQPGASSRVAITTSYTKAGLAGWVERFLAPAYLRRVYKAELKLLAHVATDRVRAASR
jgi:hypothetical protein